jgi:hypothetical protein
MDRLEPISVSRWGKETEIVRPKVLSSLARLGAVEDAADDHMLGRDPVNNDVLAMDELMRASLIDPPMRGLFPISSNTASSSRKYFSACFAPKVSTV